MATEERDSVDAVVETAQADPFSEAAIIASLPLEAQGEFKRFGVMEKKGVNELHDIMLLMRETYQIPPWHPFTYLMKQYAGGDCSGELYAKNPWVHSRYKEKSNFDASATCGNRDWYDATLRVTHKDGSVSTFSFCIQPSHRRLWSYVSEAQILSNTIWACCADGGRRSTSIVRRELFAAASAALARGETSGIIEHHVGASRGDARQTVKRKCIIATDSLNKTSDRTQAVRCKNHLGECAKESAAVPEVPPVATLKAASVAASKDVLLPMFEMACIKARELGMEETIKMWKAIIGLD